MNQMFTAPPQTHLLLRKAEVYSLLDQICQALELTAAQLEAARTSYEAVAEWLSESDNPLLKWIDIYAHGSTGLGTTVKPIGREGTAASHWVLLDYGSVVVHIFTPPERDYYGLEKHWSEAKTILRVQ